MQPYLIIFGHQISMYYVFGGAGYLSAIIFVSLRMKRIDLSYKELFYAPMLTIAVGFIGSRVVYAISAIANKGFSFGSFVSDLLHGGIVFYGGLLGLIGGCILFAVITHRKAWDVLDFAALATPLFHSIARIGCLFAGCCYGVECRWGVTNVKTPGSVLFPVQLFESICNLVIFISIILWQEIRKSDKYSMEIYLTAYSICRFVLEFYRGDTARGIWPDNLSTSQHIAAAIIFILLIRRTVLLIGDLKEKRLQGR